jgi:hypothetical protein
MELLKVLSTVIKENTNGKRIVSEAMSEKVIKFLIDKFKPTTRDTEEQITAVINAFEKYKNGLPQDQRDITKLTYTIVKNIVLSKEIKKQEKSIFKKYMEANKGADKNAVKLALRKFYELFPILPINQRDVLKMPYLKLVEFLQSKFNTMLTSAALKKFKDDKVNATPEQLIYYVSTYLDLYHRLPANLPPLLFMSFDELEHTLDGMGDLTDDIKDKKDDYSDIETIYDDDNLLIFKPSGKEQCIKLANGRSWCISKSGGGNMYYNYRLGHNLTIYYVIDKDKPFGDLNYAVVILVEPYGGKRIADGQNMSGGYSGHKREDWSTIVSKVPKLKGKEHLFVADPLSTEEQRELNNFKNTTINKDAIKELGSEQAAEMWLEISSPDLTYRSNGDEIYRNFTENLKNKYLGLGMDLTAEMINNSEPSVLKYYAARKLQGLMSKSLGQLSDADIAFINSPIMRDNKKKLREKFSGQLAGVSSSGYVGLEYPKDDNSKYVALFGFDDFFQHIPTNTTMIQMENTSKTPIALDLPESIGKLTELKTLIIDNMVKSIPESIGNCTKLKFINLPNNPQLESIPEAFGELYCLNFFSTENSNPGMRIPKKLEEYMTEDEGFWFINFPPELKKHCGPIRS